MRQYTSAYVSIRQHTSADVEETPEKHTGSSVCQELRQSLYSCTSKAGSKADSKADSKEGKAEFVCLDALGVAV